MGRRAPAQTREKREFYLQNKGDPQRPSKHRESESRVVDVASYLSLSENFSGFCWGLMSLKELGLAQLATFGKRQELRHLKGR